MDVKLGDAMAWCYVCTLPSLVYLTLPELPALAMALALEQQPKCLRMNHT
jgi:hypothetical protein